MKTLMIILSILISLTSYSNEVVKLNKGEVAPFTGALVSNVKLNDLIKAKKDLKITKSDVILLKDLNTLQDRRIELHRAEVARLETKLSRAEFKGFWTNVGFFALGVVITGVAAKAALESVR